MTGSNGQVSNITFDGTPTVVEVASCSSSNVTPTFDPGSVTVGVSCAGPVTISNNTITHVACPGGNTGAINITTAGGSAIKTYAWSNGQSTEDISDLAAGTYTVTVTSCAGTQSTTQQFTVNSNNSQIIITYVADDVECFGETNGSVDITVSGGSTTGTGCSSYAYLWSNGATTQDLTGLAAGNYTVTVTDCNGCQRISSVAEVKAPTSAIVLSETHTNVSCNGAANGNITASATGGGNNKEYRLGNGAWGTNPAFAGLTAGNYNIQVRDNFGCVKTIPVTISQPNALTVTLTANAPTPGQNNGSISAAVSGGTPSYTFAWSGPNGPVPGNPQNPSNLAPGTYCVTVTDANLCSKTGCSLVVAPLTDNPSNPSRVVRNACFNQCNGEILVVMIGGIPPYTYTWQGPSTATGSNPTDLCAGNYSVTVTSSNSGPTSTQSFVVTGAQSAPGAVSSLDVPSSSCTCDGTIALSPTGGSGTGYTYLWSNGQSGSTAIGLCEGSFSVVVTDGSQCTGTAGPFALQYDPVVLGTPNAIPSNSCASVDNGKVVLSINGGTPPYNYSIAGQTPMFNQGNAVTFTGLAPGNYSYTITDNGLCSDLQSKTGTFTIGETVLAITPVTVTHATLLL
ncbi:MAG: hypothetical protein IPN76_07735 [Saprospiraceae bacterium]|nr:hypothetical protein [Saprospiraceae bacterium]